MIEFIGARSLVSGSKPSNSSKGPGPEAEIDEERKERRRRKEERTFF